ncbi:hypothetical protein QTG54_016790 [Skeletonema marinoi]|uniref:Uncharacterized protein n=1 Tax=Skeletonema marinoi TaxID=267567 RepID=A0AAD9D3P0_9STRA|nr:hypothetical protein QTG54_016790 [Skeletonema marinoi]
MTLPRLVVLLALQIGLIKSFSPPISNIINNPQQQQQQQCTALQQSSKQSTPLSIEEDVNMIEIIELKGGIMKAISFAQNAKQMYDAILQAMPWFIRKLVQKNMNNAIAELMTVKVTENDMYDIIAKITPKSNLQDSLDVLDRYKTVTVVPQHHVKVADVHYSKEENIVATTMEEEEEELNAAAAEFFDEITFTQEENENLAASPTTQNLKEWTNTKMPAPAWLSSPHSLLSTASSSIDIDIDIIAGKKVHFKQNSKLMYDKILEGHTTLFFVRRVVKNNLDRAIISDFRKSCTSSNNTDDDGDDGVGVVIMDESDMYEVIHKASPRILLKFNMAILEEHQSTSSC